MIHQIQIGLEEGQLVVLPVPPTYEVVPDATPEGIHPRAYDYFPNPGAKLIRVKSAEAYLDFPILQVLAIEEFQIHAGVHSRTIRLATLSHLAKPLMRILRDSKFAIPHETPTYLAPPLSCTGATFYSGPYLASSGSVPPSR